jgi:hypothetical protein
VFGEASRGQGRLTVLTGIVAVYGVYVVALVASSVWISRDARKLGVPGTGRGFVTANVFLFPLPALAWLRWRRRHLPPRYVAGR